MNLSNLVFSGFNRRVAAMNRMTGDIVWQWRAPKGSTYVSLLLDSDVLIVAVDGYMYGLSPLTGKQLWFNPMQGFGTGVTSLVSLNGKGSDPIVPMVSKVRAQASCNDSTPGVSY